ncbi:cytochrome b561, DM13 and DOMON domain-containing protein At5g54830-like isoform X2 [Durio zibethinus]|uniref:Cytochrome b561, DM13 and DOMON domain-containing protein At5g54830-like isoform X2 n=1 Tax=Durio zibethinus TaxID=66656 RepID=A0A6P5WN69_DURZI|nr:cytochrome b561, DM13 and DOMON domain-containing protein At5g54830-like isoform X2 [Durio zibethinus]
MYDSKSSLLILLFLINCLFFSDADSGRKCSNTSSLNGFESNFTMVQHQLRGHLKILDDCSFEVTRFDMLSGSSDVIFWGADSLDFSNFTRGFPISDHRLNQTTYKKASFSVQLFPNLTWDQINVLSIWDITTTSDFGHVTLPLNGSDQDSDLVHTMFDNCKNLSDNYRVRWSLNVEENWIEIGLEAATRTMNYMAFGWANPNRTKELMSGADVAVAAFTEEGEAWHYPNPPNPSKVLYINKKEAPVLRVERGVPVKFSVQAGHDVALYVTSDCLGGNATSRNATETIYSGGPAAEGVVASPYELVWAPDRNTPDQVYYQSLYQQKMGWRVQVVDGGLSDMYNSSVFLDDQQVTFFWTLLEDSISFAARGVKKSGYLAIGFGSGMVNSYAYVGWIDNTGKGRVNTYWIDGKDASNVHPTNENLTHVRCRSENGIITLEFTRPFKPSCSHNNRPECKNILDPTTPLRVIWAMGAKWTDEHLSERNMHSVTSQRPVRVLLMRGSSEAEQDLRPVLAVHGFMMFLAWGILLPGGILAARYLKHVKGDGWYQIHVYLQYSGLAIVLLALLFAVAELRGFFVSSLHVKFGIAAIFFASVQPVNAYLRPKKPATGEEASSERLLWEYFHVIVGRGTIVVGIAALFTGMKHLGERYGGENVHGLSWALTMWFLIGALMVIYLEYRERQRRRNRLLGRGNWVLGNVEEEDSVDLLSPNRASAQNGLQNSGLMEVQLEPLNR